MTDSRKLSKAQAEDLLIEWDLYSPEQKEPIVNEFEQRFNGSGNHTDFLEFLRHKLEMDGYWSKAGIQ